MNDQHHPHIRAKKSLGQNFLKDDRILNLIIEAANLTEADQVLEVGPGKGALTRKILNKTNNLTAIEMDDRLIPVLKPLFGKHPKAKLIHDNALHYQPELKDYKVVANIPYYITSPLINHFLLEEFHRDNLPKQLVLMIQKEVAEKICDSKKNSVLSLAVRLFGIPRYVVTVPKTAFTPAPKIDSAVISIEDITAPATKTPELVLKLIKHCFKNPRKTLNNNLKMLFQGDSLKAQELLDLSKLDGTLRPEKLSVEDWIYLRSCYEQLKT